MTYTVQHKRSAEENRRPRPSQLADGQLALNITDSSPGLFFSTVRGDLVKIGPAHISKKAPSPTNWGNKAIGELWVDTTKDSKVAKFWTGMEWVDAGHNLQFLESHLEPSKDAFYNLGSTAKRWNNLWTRNIVCHNKVTVRTLEMTGNVASSLVPSANNTYELGTLGLRWKNINVVNANISGNVTSPPVVLLRVTHLKHWSQRATSTSCRLSLLCGRPTVQTSHRSFHKTSYLTKVRLRLGQTPTPGLKVTSLTSTQVT